MNGQAPPNTKLLLALITSCLLHAGVIFLPYAGARHRIGGSPPQATIPHAFRATFAVTRPDNAEGGPAKEVQTAAPSAPTVTEEEPKNLSPEQTDGANLLPLPAPIYYTTNQLTKRPQPDFIAELDTPETQSFVASGKIVLQLWIDHQGKVVDVLVEENDLPEVFANVAAAAFRQSRFVPGERAGLRVGSIMRIEVSYDDSRGPVPGASGR